MNDPADPRRSDFIAGRRAAHDALAQIGILDAQIRSGSKNEPLWPQGIVGSIAHAGGLAIAAVARSDTLPAVGIDVELTGAVTSEVWPDIFQESEIRFVHSQPEETQFQVATALFCVKEAFYKYLYPQTLQWIEFKDVEVGVDVETCQCQLRPKQQISIGGRKLSEFSGYYRVGKTHTIAAVF